MRPTAGTARPRRESGLQRALQEFLSVPLAIIAGFIVLGLITSVLDGSDAEWLKPATHVLAKVAPPQENQSMLRTVAPGMLTLMTITFVLLLTLVHRMSDVFTWVVVEQFLRRRVNQAFFGYFAGLSAYYVVVLALVDPEHAVFSTALALILSVLALSGLVVFGYLVLDQLRPPSVVERIVQHTIATRTEQLSWIRRMRDKSLLEHLPATTVRSECSGYLVDIHLNTLRRALESTSGEAEIEFVAKLGSHFVSGSELATVRAESAEERARLADAVLDALRCGRERQLDREPSYGVHQLSSMGWAAATQRDPEAALVAVDGLYVLLARWSRESAAAATPSDGEPALPVVYTDDTISEVLASLASIAVGAINGGQHQTCARVLDVFAKAIPQLSEDDQRTAAMQLRYALPTATRHPFTADLDRVLTELRRVLSQHGHTEAATELEHVEARLNDQLSS
ncbi:DUF2254 family protein [Mycobacterium asiaticum]|uniref:DUF2254 domain-containing protein n=1 Tax=Mycobacterium asiaticum TaxID=1790 RepID=A0A1A3N153_MYCAS|nr:DUF2254 family protein [Mycobacterium asiaticum]OBK15085.1 hypothetical protein A5636_06805 [Mycobacterium asiaticum]